MRLKWILSASVLSIVMGSTPALAAECHGMVYPDKESIDSEELVLNGMGLREATAMKVDVYVAALYLNGLENSAETILSSVAPKKLVLKFLRKVSKGQISKAWGKGLKKTAGSKARDLEDRMAQLNSWMTDLNTGSTLNFSFLPEANPVSQLIVELNGEIKGIITGDDFIVPFLSIWLGERPAVNKGLKAGLLGGTCA